jgi:hypothetical protein
VRADASKTGSAAATDGSVAVSGTVVGDINLFTGTPVQTRYREQVARIAPLELVGRSAELKELARFCTAPEPAASYVWWKGDAWAGKSALMSCFTLNPPVGVRIVSFFITSRFASQDDRNAFIENVLEQLATLLGKPIPAYLTDSTKDAHLLGMLSDAAHACKARGERLVLIVDGLDEDRGVTTGSQAYSIAALLPDPPPADMRIVVTGRPNPPVPPDVPSHHRLRDKGIVRKLTASPYAEDVRIEMENELKRLLRGTREEQDLLGFLAAARGGLSGSDLGDLCHRPAWEVGDTLRTVTGRTFSARPSRWMPGTGPDVYVLGHEDLQKIAAEFLGRERLAAYRQQLHGWADQYADRGWPESTPEYLLRGYFRMLLETRDVGRMVACATDRVRHGRMLAASGGDGAAVDEITTAIDVIVCGKEPDLSALARLAVLRDYLADRNTMIPADLPAAWASLGEEKRAQALAESIVHEGRRALALVELVKALITGRQLRLAETIAETITHPGRRGEAMMALLKAAAISGDIPTAESFLDAIASPGEQAFASIILAQAAAKTGDRRQARDFISTAEAGLSHITHPRRRAEALVALSQAEAAMENTQRARELISDAESLVSSVEKLAGAQATVWTSLVRAAFAVDGSARAQHMLGKAESAVRAITDTATRARALTTLARTAVVIGDSARARSLVDDAEILVRSMRKPARQAEVWATLLRAAAAAGAERTLELAHDAEATARSVAGVAARGSALANLSRSAIAIGQTELARRLASEAETLTRSAVDPEKRARDLAALAKVTAGAGILDQAEEIARSITGVHSHHRAEALTSVARAVAARGDLEHAKNIARSLMSPQQQAGVLVALAKDAASAGKLRDAEEVARLITSQPQQSEALTGLATGLAAAGDFDRAEITAGSIKSARQRSSAFAYLAESATAAGAANRARQYAEQAEAAAMAAPRRDRAAALLAAVPAIAATGNLEHAEEIAGSFDTPWQQGAARVSIIKIAAGAGNMRKATSAALDIEDEYWHAMAQIIIFEASGEQPRDPDRAHNLIAAIRSEIGNITQPTQRDSVFVSLAKTIAAAGRLNEAVEIAEAISEGARHAEVLAALSEMADPAHAPRLIARAVQLSHWTTSLTALVKARSAVREVVVAEVMNIAVG